MICSCACACPYGGGHRFFNHCTQQTATQVVAQLLALEAMDDREEIKVYINSPGMWLALRR